MNKSRSENATRGLSSVPAYLAYLAIAIVSIVADQVSKLWVVEHIQYRVEQIQILPIFGLVNARNYGAAFSFLNQEGGLQVWFFGGIAVVMSVVLMFWLRKTVGFERQLSLALALILGGAVGNLMDRVNYGYVVDFLWLHYQNYHFPAFNIADSVITIGAILLIMDSFGLKLLKDKTEV